ncbi:rhomboid family intramembrane serine protease [Schlesneria sp. DSM 10557]|uniref:rhomboid family intramembrane serine protease n=1 Tax=Schlesneria sp. DSM 10557 TaxID=3044399 RepID=UPI0035A04975
MFPLWDDVPSLRFPFVSYALIAACVVAFFVQLTAPNGGEQIVREYGMIPLRVTHPKAREIIVETQSQSGRRQREVLDLSSPISPLMTLFTCMFLHGGLMHIVGNMWFLYIFGDNVEDRFGHIGFAVMYFVSGLAAGIMHIMADSTSYIPTIGASGAIAGVMGSYMWLYPRASVMSLIPLGIFSRLMPIPAPIFLGIWFAFQVLSGFQTEPGGGGVAWWAHVGGFVAGLGMTAGLYYIGGLNPPVQQVRSSTYPPFGGDTRRWQSRPW